MIVSVALVVVGGGVIHIVKKMNENF